MKVLRNAGKRRLGIPGRPAIILAPGESAPITDSQLAAMERNKTVARWLDRGVLSVSDSDGKEPEAKKAKPKPKRNRRDDREDQVLPEGVTGEGVETHHKGGGWYEVYVNGFKVSDSNIRKDEAESMAAEYK